MKLKCISTGSQGNSYALIDSDGAILLLDGGMPLSDIKRGINWRISDVAGIVYTHQHYDHFGSVFDCKKAGIPIYAPFDGDEIVPKYPPKMPRWKGRIQAVPMTDMNGKFVHTNNNGNECRIYGYLISHPEMDGVLFYASDVAFIKWRFKGVTNVMLGINYADELIDKDIPAEKLKHITMGHLSLNTAIGFLQETEKQNDLRNIIICHISNENGDAKHFTDKIKKSLKKPADIHVMRKGKEIEI